MVETQGAEKSLAFEMKGGKLKVLLEDNVPKVNFKGQTYFVTESPSVTIEGKKYFVDEIV
ncbi:MAG: hypothetical protein NTV88_01710 [Candidatus Micrarchaeota archaeon]|nr:hypothetical protein [Candidatus Micrarchaeota archaeon]